LTTNVWSAEAAASAFKAEAIASALHIKWVRFVIFKVSRGVPFFNAAFLSGPTPRSAGVGHLPSVVGGKIKWVRFTTFFPPSPIKLGTSFCNFGDNDNGGRRLHGF